MPRNPDFLNLETPIEEERRAFMLRFSEIFRIRENCFSEYTEIPIGKRFSAGSKYAIVRQEFFGDGHDEYFQVSDSPEKLLAILYDPYEIDRLQVLARSVSKPVVAYIFPMSARVPYGEFLPFSENVRVETIPGWILEAYRKVFLPLPVRSLMSRE